MNKMTITGRLGKDPESTITKTGAQMVKFSVCVYISKDKVSWVNVLCMDKAKDIALMCLKKGHKALIEGTPSVDAYIKDGKAIGIQTIFANTIELLGNNENNSSSEFPIENQVQSANNHKIVQDKMNSNHDDKIPF